MALPITIPNTFAGATSAIPLSQLDNNFTTVVNGINGIGNGTNSLANVSITGGSIANVTLTGTVTAPTNGYRRNRIINGGMAVDQRNNGASQTFVAAAPAYSVDRWYGYCTGANVTGARVAGSSINQYRYQFTGAASVTAIGFAQRIEAINSYDLNNGTAFLSVDLANSLLTTVTWTAYYANTTDTFGTVAAPTKTQIATGTFTVTSTVTNYTASISVPSAATTGIEIVLTVGAQTSGTWTIGNVQLEAGSSSTPFERLPIGETLMLCQRYYGITGMTTVSAVTYQYWNTAFWKSTMRASPTLSVVQGSLSGATVANLAYAANDGIRQTSNASAGTDVSIAGSAEL